MLSPADEGKCDPLFEYLAEVGTSPHIRAKDSCVIFDVDAYNGKDLSFENKATVTKRCGVSRCALQCMIQDGDAILSFDMSDNFSNPLIDTPGA